VKHKAVTTSTGTEAMKASRKAPSGRNAPDRASRPTANASTEAVRPTHEIKIIEEVIVKFHHLDDSISRVMIIKNEGGGHYVDAIVFDNSTTEEDELIQRLGIKDGEVYKPAEVVTKGLKHRKWKVQVLAEKPDPPGERPHHCVWIHDENCNWSENCDD
jgi:hypothetical protein